MVLEKLVPPHQQIELESTLKTSKKQGVAYIQSRDTKIEDVLTEMSEKVDNKF